VTLLFFLYFSDSKSNGGKRSSKKMDSVNASKTNETSKNAATLEDNGTAPQEAQNTPQNSSATTTKETLKHGSDFIVK
jgi:hypothetical protein